MFEENANKANDFEKQQMLNKFSVGALLLVVINSVIINSVKALLVSCRKAAALIVHTS